MRILYIAGTFNPFDVTSGSNIRAHYLCKALCNLGQTDIITFNPNIPRIKDKKIFNINNILYFNIGQYPFWGISEKILKNATLTKLYRLYHILIKRNPFFYTNPKLKDQLIDHLEKESYDIIFVQRLETAVLLGLLEGDNVLIDIDDHPVDSIDGRYLSKNTIIKFISKIKIKRLYKEYREKYKIFFLSNKHQVKDKKERYLPNLCFESELKNKKCMPKDSCSLLFIGSMSYGPNQKGILKFVNHIWPHVIKQIPNSTLKVIGGGMPDDLKEKLSRKTGVEVLGFVENISEVYNNSNLVISPIYSGGGTNIKILEAIKKGKPIICTRFSIRGYDFLKDGENIMIAKNNKEFVTKTILLIKNPDLGKKISDKALYDYSRSEISYDNFFQIIKDSFQEIIDNEEYDPK